MSAAPTIYILDANILLRLADADAAGHQTAQNAVKSLRASGAVLRTIPQAIFEFWVVATRPKNKNGLGLSVADAETFVDLFVRVYWPLPDDPALLTNWRKLVVKHGVSGKPAHDARYIASMQSHGLTHLMTFDSDFNRYAADGITIINPPNVPAVTQ